MKLSAHMQQQMASSLVPQQYEGGAAESAFRLYIARLSVVHEEPISGRFLRPLIAIEKETLSGFVGGAEVRPDMDVEQCQARLDLLLRNRNEEWQCEDNMLYLISHVAIIIAIILAVLEGGPLYTCFTVPLMSKTRGIFSQRRRAANAPLMARGAVDCR